MESIESKKALLSFLVTILSIDYVTAMEVMSLWIFLERQLSTTIIARVSFMPATIISALVEESTSLLNFLKGKIGSSSKHENEIPLLDNFLDKRPSFEDFRHNGCLICKEIDRIREAEVYGVAILNAKDTRGNQNVGRVLDQNYDKTIFLVFARETSLEEVEIRACMEGNYGNCIESLFIQNVRYGQPLYAEIVFTGNLFVSHILNGKKTTKFTMNGKPIWAHKFEKNY
ncbi:hypothetical protein ACFE04_004478 [Oxalis oulophora]